MGLFKGGLLARMICYMGVYSRGAYSEVGAYSRIYVTYIFAKHIITWYPRCELSHRSPVASPVPAIVSYLLHWI